MSLVYMESLSLGTEVRDWYRDLFYPLCNTFLLVFLEASLMGSCTVC